MMTKNLLVRLVRTLKYLLVNLYSNETVSVVICRWLACCFQTQHYCRLYFGSGWIRVTMRVSTMPIVMRQRYAHL